MKKKSLIQYVFLLLLTWTAPCNADNCSVDGWCKEYNPDLQMNFLRAIWGSSKNDVFAVGSDWEAYNSWVILHYDRSNWSIMASGITYGLFDVWGSNENDVFAVGRGGTILHYDGTSWSPMESGTTNTLLGVWGNSGNDVFAVGNNGTILHYDGSQWSTMGPDTTYLLKDVWGSSENDVFVVGVVNGGTIMCPCQTLS